MSWHVVLELHAFNSTASVKRSLNMSGAERRGTSKV